MSQIVRALADKQKPILPPESQPKARLKALRRDMNQRLARGNIDPVTRVAYGPTPRRGT